MKKKLQLHDLQVKSFITNVDAGAQSQLKGGVQLTGNYPTLPAVQCINDNSVVPTRCCTGYYPSLNSNCTVA